MADLGSLSREELIELILAQQRMISELREEIEQLRRGGLRQAAPFSKGTRVENPKPPGRKPGQGPFTRRATPRQEATETILAQVPGCCPHCGGELEQQSEEIATITDLPVCPRPVITAYRMPVCHCRQCGKRVRATAPGLPPDQAGATAHRLGPRLMAAAHTLHYAVGIPVRKVPAVLSELTGVSLTQGAISRGPRRWAVAPA